jgi:hypothetical protein
VYCQSSLRRVDPSSRGVLPCFFLLIYQSIFSITVSNTTSFGLLLNCAVDYNYSAVYLVTIYSVLSIVVQ